MSRTGIYFTTPQGGCTVSNPTGHIDLEAGDEGATQVIVPGKSVAFLVASIGDPSTGKDNTGTLQIASGNFSFTIDLRKRTGKDMQLLSIDPTSPPVISSTNDFSKDDDDPMKRTSITIHVQSPQ